MEAFSLLRYWRTTDGGTTTTNLRPSTASTTTTTISTSMTPSTPETDDIDDENGPFFDLEFAFPDEQDADDGEEQTKQKTDGGDEERDENEDEDGNGTDFENEEREEFKFTLSPSDDLFFNGNLLPVEPSSVVSIDGSDQQIVKPQFSLLKSASKFGVLMLKLKKSKASAGEKQTEPDPSSVSFTKQSEKDAEAQTQKPKSSQSKLFTVKFKAEEMPIVSLFTRENSSRASSGTINNKSQKEEASVDESGSDEKRVSRDGVQKYLNMVKPLYIRVSKRYAGEKSSSGFSGQLSLGGETKAAVVQSPIRSEVEKSEKTEASEQLPLPENDRKSGEKQGKVLPAGLRVVYKHFGKSRSASSSAAVAVAAAPPSSGLSTVSKARRRDDSLLEQQDGIQSAILHCKRSFNLSRDSDSSQLSRSASDPSPKNPSN